MSWLQHCSAWGSIHSVLAAYSHEPTLPPTALPALPLLLPARATARQLSFRGGKTCSPSQSTPSATSPRARCLRWRAGHSRAQRGTACKPLAGCLARSLISEAQLRSLGQAEPSSAKRCLPACLPKLQMPSHLDIGLPDGTGDAEYLRWAGQFEGLVCGSSLSSVFSSPSSHPLLRQGRHCKILAAVFSSLPPTLCPLCRAAR